MATVQDTYADSTKLSSLIGTEVSSGVLQNKDIGESSCYSFDGTNDLITIADASNLSFGNGTTDSAFSFSIWVTPMSNSRAIFAKATSATAGEYYVTTSSGAIFFRLVDNSTGGFTGVTCTFPDVNISKFLLFTYSGSGGSSGMKIYIDGILQATTTSNSGTYVAMENLTTALKLGERESGSNYFMGYQEDAAIYNAELTADNARDLFLEVIEPSSLSCVSRWKLNGDANDSVGSNHGTVSGATAVTSVGFYTKTGTAVSTNRLGISSISAANSFKYTSTQKSGGTRNVYQFSDDNATWKNSAGKLIDNTGCYSFDGVDDKMEKTIANYRSGDSSGSITARIYINSTAAVTKVIFSSSDTGTDTSYFFFRVSTTNKLEFGTRNAAGTANILSGGTILQIGRWYDVAVTSSGTAWKLYVDNVEEALTVSSGTNTGDWFADITLRDNINVGAWVRTTLTGTFSGLVDDVSVYTDTLTRAQIESINLGTTIPTDYNVVNRWKLDGNANDSVGSDNLTITGAVSVTDWWRLKHVGDAVCDTNSLYFDGTGDYAEIANEANFDFERTNTFSIGAWIKTTYTAATMIVIGKIQNTGNLAGYQLVVMTDGKVRVDLINNFGTGNHLRETTVFGGVNNGLKHYLLVTYDGSSTPAGLKIYIDGTEAATTTDVNGLSASILNAIPVQISGRGNAATTPFFGQISNLAIWNDVRTAGEALTDFQNGYHDSSDANMVSGWAVNEGTGTTLTDVKGANNGTINGNPQWIKDEYRPIPAAPTQQTIDLSVIGGAYTGFYYREFRQSQSGFFTVKTTEVTLDYTSTSSPSSSISSSPSSSVSSSPSSSISSSPSSSISSSPSSSISSSPSSSPSPSSSISSSPSSSISASPSSSVSASPSSSPSASVSSSPSASVSSSPSSSVSASPSSSPSSSVSTSPSSSISSSPSSSVSSSPSTSPSSSISASPSSSPSASPSAGYELYTRGDEGSLPANDNNLETNYSAQDYIDVDTKNDVRVGQTATAQYAMHQFKDFVSSSNSCTLEWEGQTDFAPSASPVVLQIYNRDTTAWETVDSDNTTATGTDFILTAVIPDLTDYKDGSNIISCRVYQLSS